MMAKKPWARAGYDLKLMVDLARKFPIGSRVKYIGTRAADHQGKIGTVVWYQDANGLVLEYDDGSTGSSIPDNVELVSLPKMSPDQVAALRENAALLFARVTGEPAEADAFRRLTSH